MKRNNTSRTKRAQVRVRVSKCFEPNEVQRIFVTSAAAMGYRQRFIAEKIPDGPISIDTLQKHFKKDWEAGKNNLIQLTEEQILYKKAISGKSSRRTQAARIKWLRLSEERKND